MHGGKRPEIAILVCHTPPMKRPSNAFLHDDIAAHLGARELGILADAETYQHWDYNRQKALFAIPKDDADAVLGWLKDTFALGQKEFSGRWPAGVSVLQARSHVQTENASSAANEIKRIDAARDDVAMASMSILARDDRYTILYEEDAMAGERISTGALLAMVDGTYDAAEDAVKAAISAVSQDLLGFDISQDG